jgi:hypothetical protein
MSEMTVRARVTNFYNLPDWYPDWCRRVGATA